MISFTCRFCSAPLQAEDALAGKTVRCPTCKTTMPVPQSHLAAVAAAQKSLGMTLAAGMGRKYGFNCPYCSSRLEAVEAMAAQEGTCPTCGSTIVIPIMDRWGRLIDPTTQEIIKPDPHPVHAYAAAGDRAPVIQRSEAGEPVIICPRCKRGSVITANNCKACGMPFTMEGTTVPDVGASDGFCVASLVLGVIGIPTALFVVPSLLAVVFGLLGYFKVAKAGAESSGKGMAIGGIVCGVVGLGLFLLMVLR